LGGEITTEKFQDQFAGKQIMNNGNVVPIEFDAITGATKTSNGVKEMIDNTLEKYSAYLSRIAERGGRGE
jgi:Na+-transporting NADH:ubiquinone oxidoreductase subunit C